MDAQDPPTPPSRTIRNCACLYRSSSAASELEPLTRDDSSRSQSSHRDSDSYEWEENGYTTSPDCPPHSRSTNESHSSTSSALSTVAGLLVHSIADGISLGASSLSSPSPSSSPVNGDTSLDFIIFLAIMVHKAPAAFALSALLSTTPATTPTFVRHSLLAFSFAAPLGALLTYFLLTLVGAESGAGVGWWTGIALVFSGGTFLFVATHVMKGKDGDEADVTGTGKRGKMGLVIGGMVTPLILSKLVGHGH
jgi:zinc transporter 9